MLKRESLEELTENVTEVVRDVASLSAGTAMKSDLKTEKIRSNLFYGIFGGKTVGMRASIGRSHTLNSEQCDPMLPDGTPGESKRIRCWWANGDPEPKYDQTRLQPVSSKYATDVHRLEESEVGD